ncbi:MAG: sulfatase [Planctomycetales bacterium]|nr:sulfatase [Planctomycetales bacterium]
MVPFSRLIDVLRRGPKSTATLIACVVALVVWSGASNDLAKADETAAPNQRPNVVVILVDDLGWNDVGFQGSTFYQTPELDRLAERGLRFTRGYAACQVCSPSRASLMTGRFPPRHGITDYIGAPWGTNWKRNTPMLPAQYAMRLAADERTLAERFRDAGYRTFYAGKWHLGDEGSFPTDHGFEFNAGGNATGTPRGGFFAPFENPQLADREPGESLTLRLGEETASFINEHHDEPFLAYLAFYAVHAPVQTTQERWEKYRELAAEQGSPEHRFVVDRTLPVRQVQDHPVYAGMIETMDQAIGKVVAELERHDLLDNTIIVFTSDNGGVSSGDAFATSNLPLRGGKGRQWEGGFRVPLLYVVPGLTNDGGQCGVPASGIDLLPTLCELCSVPTENEPAVDGISLVPALHGQDLPSRSLFWHYPHYGNQGGEPSAVIQRDDWKLIRYYEDGREELYHLSDDMAETRDVSEEQPTLVAELSAELSVWLEATEAKLPIANPNFNTDAAAAERQRIENQLLPNLERQHARLLDADWQPNANWWGSTRD